MQLNISARSLCPWNSVENWDPTGPGYSPPTVIHSYGLSLLRTVAPGNYTGFPRTNIQETKSSTEWKFPEAKGTWVNVNFRSDPGSKQQKDRYRCPISRLCGSDFNGLFFKLVSDCYLLLLGITVLPTSWLTVYNWSVVPFSHYGTALGLMITEVINNNFTACCATGCTIGWTKRFGYNKQMA